MQMETLLLFMLLSGLQSSSAPRITALASPSEDTVLTQDPLCRDEELLRLEFGDPFARLWLPQGAWCSLLGDADQNGSFDFPAGVDGLTWAPRGRGPQPTVLDLWFSMDADFQTWKDGDVLRISEAGAIELVYSEDSIRTALGTASALDLDALAINPQGKLCFSLRDGITVSVLGAIADGDVLVYDPAGSVSRMATEAEVQAWVDYAVPGAGAIGDVKGLSFEPTTGDLLFLVQSPSAHDATVFSAAQGGMIYAGFAESDWGFQQSTELDAIAFVPSTFTQAPILTCDVQTVAPGQSFTLHLQHATPNTVIQGLAANRRSLRSSDRGGFGLSVVDLGAVVRTWPVPAGSMVSDGVGSASAQLTAPPLPAGVLTLDLVYQAWDGSGAGLSTPTLVRVQ